MKQEYADMEVKLKNDINRILEDKAMEERRLMKIIKQREASIDQIVEEKMQVIAAAEKDKFELGTENARLNEIIQKNATDYRILQDNSQHNMDLKEQEIRQLVQRIDFFRRQNGEKRICHLFGIS